MNQLDAIREIKSTCRTHGLKFSIEPRGDGEHNYKFLDAQNDNKELMCYDNLIGAYIGATDGSLFAYLTVKGVWK